MKRALKTYSVVLTETTRTTIRFKAANAQEALKEMGRIERAARRGGHAKDSWRLLRPKTEVEADLGPLPE